MTIVVFLFSYIFLNKSTVCELFLLAFIFSTWVYSVLELFFQFPHWKIPEDYSKEAKTAMYFTQFVMISFGLYIYSVGILQHYYPFFEKLACCDMVKNFELTWQK